MRRVALNIRFHFHYKDWILNYTWAPYWVLVHVGPLMIVCSWFPDYSDIPMPELEITRILLTDKDFANLVKGKIVEFHPDAEIALQDIGWYQMIDIIEKAIKEQSERQN